MKMLVTGAGGFIGQFVVREALRRAHRVVALTRSATPESWRANGQPEVIRQDLAQVAMSGLEGRGVDVIIHLAAAMQGSVESQFRDTVTATEQLLKAARNAGIRRVVGVSTIAVLDYTAAAPMTLIDEQTKRVPVDLRTGPYARCKLKQEWLLSGFGGENGNSCVILRPGLVYDETRLSAAHAGIIKGAIRLLVEHGGEVPTVEVRGLAAALVNAAERGLPGCEVMHLVDDDLPSQQRYLGGLRRREVLGRGGIIVPWRILSGMCACLRAVSSAVGLGGKMPEVLLKHSFAARLKPFRFSNALSKERLGWVPGRGFT
jgi:2-alkyl-3-oxoalkanoate reductase